MAHRGGMHAVLEEALMDLLSWDKKARSEWRKALRELRILCPAQFPVRVKRVRMPDGELGDCSWAPRTRRFTIRVSSEIPPRWAIDVLAHEHAHALVWFIERVDDHGPSWGVAYARVYQQIEGVH